MPADPANSTWEPISKVELQSLIAVGESEMEPHLRAFWDQVRIEPVKWSLPPWGDQGDGFWIVAIMGHTVVWYNDIEEGFDVSTFESFGLIGQYQCSQMELTHCINRLLPQN